MMLSRFATTGGAVQKTYVDDVFSTSLYTGNGSTLTINNGIDLAGKGGMVWLKRRSGSDSHYLWDTARGQINFLSTDLVNAQSPSPGQMTFGSSGFTLGGGAFVNGSDVTFSSWTFRKAPKFFDVVTFTYSALANINHSLGTTPAMVILKQTDGAGDSWYVYHTGLGAVTTGVTPYLWLNGSFGSNSISWLYALDSTKMQFLGLSAGNYVAYLFADDPSADGLIRSGSFTTDGSGNASVSTLGWEPQFLLVKASSTTGDWIMLDSMRGWNLTANDAKLIANGADAESTTTEYGNPTATGFDFKGGSASATYIYMAIRRSNKPPTNGTEVFNLQASSVNGAAITGVISTSGPSKIDTVIRAFRSGDSRNFEFYDRLRGISSSSTVSSDSYTSPRLSSSSTSSEVTTGTDVYQRSGAAGFADYVAFMSVTTGTINYAFKRAPGFFDVVCYAGDNTPGQLVYHNLGTTPELIICKPRSGTYGTDPWAVACSFVGESFITSIDLNTNAASGLTTSGITSGTTSLYPYNIRNNANYNPNRSGTAYVAYLFASLPGISKVGTYTGNGTSQTINCGFSTGARFVLIKRTDSTGDWYVWDTARGISSGNDPHLSLNGTAAEVTTDDSVDVDSSGFVVNQVAATNINVSAATFLYLAIS